MFNNTARTEKICYIHSQTWAPITLLFGGFSWVLGSEAGMLAGQITHAVFHPCGSLFWKVVLVRMRLLRLFLRGRYVMCVMGEEKALRFYVSVNIKSFILFLSRCGWELMFWLSLCISFISWNAVKLSKITTECHIAFAFYPLALFFEYLLYS